MNGDNGDNGDNGENYGENNGDEFGYRKAMPLVTRVILLHERVKNLQIEFRQIKLILSTDKRDLILRLSKLEITYQRVFGIILIFPVLGAILGFVATYWSVLFKPWSSN